MLKKLVEKAQNGDEQAYDKIYNELFSKIYASCLGRLEDSGASEELAHDILVKIWAKIPTYKGLSSFNTWVWRIARNEITNYVRGNKFKDEIVLEDECYDPQENWDLKIDLERAINSLPDKLRIPFVMKEVEGYNYREISLWIGLSERTLRDRIGEAKEQ